MEEKKDQEKLIALRHSAEHVLTQAMLKLYPGIKMAMGPATEDGFYFDFDPGEHKISEDDFPQIEAEMKKIIAADLPLRRQEISVEEARKLFSGNEYKQEWLDEIEARGEKASVYWTGEGFVDLCAGPHLKSTGEIKAFKLLSIAGSYWRGDEKNKMLTRIYGTAFFSPQELEKYLHMLAEARKRDHRQIARQQELFIIDEEFGKGLPLWLPKGALLRQLIMDFALETYLAKGYQLVATPHIARLELWQRSGHWDFYRDSMYTPIEVEKEQFVIKPMNCPGHVKIYNSQPHSYRELPLKFTEMGTVYRFEKSGELSGLTRVRGFTQDDAHIFCAPEQLQETLIETIQLTRYILETFGFKDPEISLSVRDPENKAKYLGEDKTWAMAEEALEKALKAEKLKYTRYPGEAAFYGPKIDVLVKDAIGRSWQLSTIQVDFNFPQKFAMSYTNAQGEKQTPIMIHRALLGSLERFIGVLIEHYAGAFPLWLAPEQIWILPLGKNHQNYARKIAQELEKEKIRVRVKDENETIAKKIREGEIQKIPYLLVVGDKEKKENTISVRQRGQGDIGSMDLASFKEKIKKEIRLRTS